MYRYVIRHTDHNGFTRVLHSDVVYPRSTDSVQDQILYVRDLAEQYCRVINNGGDSFLPASINHSAWLYSIEKAEVVWQKHS